MQVGHVQHLSTVPRSHLKPVPKHSKAKLPSTYCCNTRGESITPSLQRRNSTKILHLTVDVTYYIYYRYIFSIHVTLSENIRTIWVPVFLHLNATDASGQSGKHSGVPSSTQSSPLPPINRPHLSSLLLGDKMTHPPTTIFSS